MDKAERERAKFEAWANSVGYTLKTNHDGSYKIGYGDELFEGWAARAESAPSVSVDEGLLNSVVMPPSKGQSHVLFEDGYAEGWAKCMTHCLEALQRAEASKAQPMMCVMCDGHGRLGFLRQPCKWCNGTGEAHQPASRVEQPSGELGKSAEPFVANNDEVICPACCHQFAAIPVNVQKEIADLQARLDDAEKDAEKDAVRYRWLRNKSTGPAAIWELVSDERNPPYWTLKCEEELDADIDAALSKKGTV